ncbi:carboxyl transferase domain-containing protein [Actinoplanes sp. NPDC024001]|uniref:carboxyl transferase domain-containing protein n=1 Tax=Actinoplanes sp. NPDC024001 TaxID=3154598 RepID=UPI0033E6D109
MTVLDTALDPRDPAYLEGRSSTLQLLAELEAVLDQARAGGGEKWVTRHHARGKLLPRERIEMLLDQDGPFLELSPAAAWGSEFPVGASVVTGVGVVAGVECMVIANDPTVDGGAVNPYTADKIRRAARIASVNRLPMVNLVESSGSGTSAGGIARELSRLTADRAPTICVIFGLTTGDAAYLPALSDYTIMVRGHAKVLTIHPQPVRGSANGHASVDVRATPVVPAGPAGPADQLAEDERDGLRLARQCVRRLNWRKHGPPPRTPHPAPPRYDAEDLLTLAAADPAGFEPREVLARILDDSDFDEFKPGQSTGVLAGWGELHGYPLGVLATPSGPCSAAEAQKAVHFLHLANATATPLLFLRHRGAPGDEETDARHDAPLVHAVAKSAVPHLVLTIGEADADTADRAGEPRFGFSWPAKGPSSADDGVIDPRDTRTVLGLCLSAVHSAAVEGAGHVGVFRP